MQVSMTPSVPPRFAPIIRGLRYRKVVWFSCCFLDCVVGLNIFPVPKEMLPRFSTLRTMHGFGDRRVRLRV